MVSLIPVIQTHDVHTITASVEGFSGWCSVCDITDDVGEIRRVYLKVFEPESNGLAGEVIRWTLASALSIPQPPLAWMVQVPAIMLASLWPNVEWEEAWGDIVPGFATTELQSLTPPSTVAWYQDPGLRRQLNRWPHIHAVVALDEWLANDDGNLENLIYITDSNGPAFATIDGGRVLGGENWTLQSLEDLLPTSPRCEVRNKLLRAAFGTLPSARVIDALQSAGAKHLAALEAAQQHLYFWLTEILDDGALTWQALQTLRERASLPWLDRRRKIANA